MDMFSGLHQNQIFYFMSCLWLLSLAIFRIMPNICALSYIRANNIFLNSHCYEPVSSKQPRRWPQCVESQKTPRLKLRPGWNPKDISSNERRENSKILISMNFCFLQQYMFPSFSQSRLILQFQLMINIQNLSYLKIVNSYSFPCEMSEYDV